MNYVSIALGVLGACLATSACAGELLTNGNFEGGAVSSTIGGYTNNSVPAGWTANEAFDEYPGFNHLSSGNGVGGSTSLSISNYDDEPLAAVSQQFADVAGQTYSVTFYGYDGGSNGDANAYLMVSVGSASAMLGDTTQTYTEGSFTFIGTGSDTLMIAAQTNPSEWYVDDVSVQGAAASPVPEPGSALMMMCAAGVLGVRLSQRRR